MVFKQTYSQAENAPKGASANLVDAKINYAVVIKWITTVVLTKIVKRAPTVLTLSPGLSNQSALLT